ncbi:hypothetical protein IQ264_23815 [Phormidium sp. LEGE 05292]|uniref:hypothetical protein n=1 Tax=[Phormidium] sp. LEGE 05292 TaxID=767427 RepID=UPI0018812FA1|nr:hypothetical protein [Phormidium sp. LEGE 05292]MBE9228449.1 hypothetical protein [Phormidium sp. LEGE 05292]
MGKNYNCLLYESRDSCPCQEQIRDLFILAENHLIFGKSCDRSNSDLVAGEVIPPNTRSQVQPENEKPGLLPLGAIILSFGRSILKFAEI